MRAAERMPVSLPLGLCRFSWFCFSGDFFICGLSKTPFGDIFLFFSRVLNTSSVVKQNKLFLVVVFVGIFFLGWFSH